MQDTATKQSEDPRFDDEIILLPGWPGYRTRAGRSGLDYLDTQYEIAHMAGLMLRRLFTKTWNRPGIDPHPLVTLLSVVVLWLAFPGSAAACPAILLVLLAALVNAVVSGLRGRKNSEGGEDASGDEDDSEADAATEPGDEEA